MENNEILLQEWKEVRETLRYFGNKRFAQLTVFIVAEGAVMSAFFNPANADHYLVLRFAGLLLAASFFIMECSSVIYWNRFAERGEEIEKELATLKLMRKHQPKERGLWSGTNATFALYLGAALFWLVSFGSWGPPVSPEPFRIVVAGDGRAEYPSASPLPHKSPRAEDEDGINKVITREIVQAVLDEKAKMLLWTGDMSNLTEDSPVTFERQLLAWRDIVQPLYDKGIKVLPVRGNHEVVWYDPKDRKPHDIPGAKAAWDRVFAGRYALPANGPASEKNISFFDVLDSVLVIGLDHYANPHSVNQSWLRQVLEEQKKPFVFVYGHEPAFAAGSHTDDETLAADPVKRNELWETLIQAGARVYFCGHDHFYDHMLVTREGANNGSEMHQLTAGTAGAPFYEQGTYTSNLGWKLNVVHHAKANGYMVVAIDRTKATIMFKGRTAPDHYEVMDSFSYVAANP